MLAGVPVWNNTGLFIAAAEDDISMDRESLRISGPAGLDPQLEIAGPGTRSYAFVIDWHIRLLLALAWLSAVWLKRAVAGAALPSPTALPEHFALVAIAPAAAIYVLYHPVLELTMRGRTPGKRVAGARIVTRDGGTPGVTALLVRNLLRLVDSLPVCYMVGLMSCFATAQSVRLGDLAAGTLLVRERGAADGCARS